MTQKLILWPHPRTLTHVRPGIIMVANHPIIAQAYREQDRWSLLTHDGIVAETCDDELDIYAALISLAVWNI